MLTQCYVGWQYSYEDKADRKNSLHAHSLSLNLLFEAQLKLQKKNQLP